VSWENGVCASLNLGALVAKDPQIQMEIVKRIIWNVGGKKYQTRITEIMLRKILAGEINTLGRCLIKIKKDVAYVLPERRKVYGDELSFANSSDEKSKSASEFGYGLLYVDQNRKISRKNSNAIPNRIGLLDVFIV
jgi:hypothetical protein